MSSKAAAKGHTSKHVSGRKHHGTSKHHPTRHPAHHKAAGHHVHAKGTHAHHAKARGFAPSAEWLPACSLEAVAMSLRLLGQPVADDEVAWLWELAGSRELSIGEALQAAARFGLGGFVPALAHQVVADLGDDLAVLQVGARIGEHLFRRDAAQFEALAEIVADRPLARRLQQSCRPPVDDPPGARVRVGAEQVGVRGTANGAAHAVILGVDRPGPHAVLATPDGWWSWGSLYSPWPCRIEEAVAVSWSA